MEITTDFAGQDILVFGAIDGPGDVILVMRGPAGRVAVHRSDYVPHREPALTGVTPARGPHRVATPVTLVGNEFLAGGATVSMAALPPSSVVAKAVVRTVPTTILSEVSTVSSALPA